VATLAGPGRSPRSSFLNGYSKGNGGLRRPQGKRPGPWKTGLGKSAPGKAGDSRGRAHRPPLGARPSPGLSLGWPRSGWPGPIGRFDKSGSPREHRGTPKATRKGAGRSAQEHDGPAVEPWLVTHQTPRSSNSPCQGGLLPLYFEFAGRFEACFSKLGSRATRAFRVPGGRATPRRAALAEILCQGCWGSIVKQWTLLTSGWSDPTGSPLFKATRMDPRQRRRAPWGPRIVRVENWWGALPALISVGAIRHRISKDGEGWTRRQDQRPRHLQNLMAPGLQRPKYLTSFYGSSGQREAPIPRPHHLSGVAVARTHTQGRAPPLRSYSGIISLSTRLAANPPTAVRE